MLEVFLGTKATGIYFRGTTPLNRFTEMCQICPLNFLFSGSEMKFGYVLKTALSAYDAVSLIENTQLLTLSHHCLSMFPSQ